jgi:hypothetical protein
MLRSGCSGIRRAADEDVPAFDVPGEANYH